MRPERYPYRTPGGLIRYFEVGKKRRGFKGSDAAWVRYAIGKTMKEAERGCGGKCQRLPVRDVAYMDQLDHEFQEAWRDNPDGTIRVDEAEKVKIQAARAANPPEMTDRERMDVIQGEIDLLKAAQ